MNKLFVFLLFIIAGVNGLAQELSVDSFEKSLDPMTVSIQKKDLNGFICPLVKVQLPITGVKFEGNIVDVRFDVNEYLVYLSPNSKMIAIKCPGYKTLKVYFNDYNISCVVSKSIYVLDVRTNNDVQHIVPDLKESNEVDTFNKDVKSGDEELWTVFFDKDFKAGFANSDGKIFIEAKFDDALLFSEGLAGVKIGDKWGFIDGTGEVVIPVMYDEIKSFKSGNAIIGKTIYRDGLNIKHYCLIDYTGKQCTSYYEDIDYFRDDRAKIVSNGKYGFVNRAGDEIIPPIYEKALNFSNGYAEIKCNEKWGVIDTYGKEVIKAEYEDIEPSDFNLVAVSKNGKWGYLNMSGEKITKFEFDDADGFEDYDLTVVEKNELCGLINTDGKIVLPIKYDELDIVESKDGIDYSFMNLVRASKNEKYGIVDLKNKTIVPFKYDYLDFTEANGLIVAEIGNKRGYINKKGQVIIDFKYDEAIDFCDGVGLVRMNGKWGGVNINGEVVIPFMYESIKEVPYGNNNGLFTMKLNGKWGCVNAIGHVKIPFIYDEFNYFRAGRVRVKQGNYEFIINEKGKKVSESHPNNQIWP